mmetsp:Transcript_37702/g.79484  ORF Transcript_37702/g.79484 Transcript_37702/m.79484 type:complete len:411 (+) Transcript_37702:205-1437(+)
MNPFLRFLPCSGVGLLLLGTSSGFTLTGGLKKKVPQTILSSTATSNDSDTNNSLGGVSDFEEWFEANSSAGAQFNNIRHALFNSMGRGLQFTSTKSSDLSKVAVVPRKLVLNVPFSDEGDSSNGRSWDTNLSCKLWQECLKGKASAYYGYCSLLTRGASTQPGASTYLSTAPDALRHWTPSQRSLLEKSEKGKKLLEVENKQQEEWRQKYESLVASEKEKMTFEQFSWAMEAVHSRAFRGDFGALDGGEGGPIRKIASLLLPFSALAFGLVYASDPFAVDQYFLPIAVVAAAPVALNIIADAKGSKEAVMLPLIDSANHLQEADSVIEYDPAVNGFVLSLGRKCLVKEVDETGERAQVCISYGVRKDSELLLNYGFLRGCTMEGLENKDGEENRDVIRQRLAEQFVSQNP